MCTMNLKPAARTEALKAIAITLTPLLFIITTVAYGLFAGFAVLFPSMLVILALTKSDKSEKETKELSAIDKAIYLIIAILLATFITAIILIAN